MKIQNRFSLFIPILLELYFQYSKQVSTLKFYDIYYAHKKVTKFPLYFYWKLQYYCEEVYKLIPSLCTTYDRSVCIYNFSNFTFNILLELEIHEVTNELPFLQHVWRFIRIFEFYLLNTQTLNIKLIMIVESHEMLCMSM